MSLTLCDRSNVQLATASSASSRPVPPPTQLPLARVPLAQVRAWPLVAEDPIPPPPSRDEAARRYDPDDLSQYYTPS